MSKLLLTIEVRYHCPLSSSHFVLFASLVSWLDLVSPSLLTCSHVISCHIFAPCRLICFFFILVRLCAANLNILPLSYRPSQCPSRVRLWQCPRLPSPTSSQDAVLIPRKFGLVPEPITQGAAQDVTKDAGVKGE